MLRRAMIALAAGSGILLAGTAVSAKPTGGIWKDNSPGKTTAKTKPAPKVEDAAEAEPAGQAKDAAKVEPVPGEAAAAANADANVNANASANAHSQARANSQGPANANVRAIERANDNSVLADGAVASSALPGLTTGLTVKNSGGSSLGTVSEVITGTDGSIRTVVVTSTDGTTIRLMPDQLSIAGGIVTTTQTDFGG